MDLGVHKNEHDRNDTTASEIINKAAGLYSCVNKSNCKIEQGCTLTLYLRFICVLFCQSVSQ